MQKVHFEYILGLIERSDIKGADAEFIVQLKHQINAVLVALDQYHNTNVENTEAAVESQPEQVKPSKKKKR